MTYRLLNDKYAGFVDLRISDVYMHCPEFFEALGLFITCLDSTNDVATLKKWSASLVAANIRYKIVDRAVFIPPIAVASLFAHGKTFYGFDEVYLTKACPASVPSRRFTTDGVDFGNDIPKEFWAALDSVKATRYLADGCGLNFLCEAKPLAERLEEIERNSSSKEQQ